MLLRYVKESRNEKLYIELLSHLHDANEPNLIRMLQLHPPHLHHLEKNEYYAWKERQKNELEIEEAEKLASAEELSSSPSPPPHSPPLPLISRPLSNPMLKLKDFGSHKAEEGAKEKSSPSSSENHDARMLYVNDEKSLQEAIALFEQHAKSLSATGTNRTEFFSLFLEFHHIFFFRISSFPCGLRYGIRNEQYRWFSNYSCDSSARLRK